MTIKYTNSNKKINPTCTKIYKHNNI